MHQDEIWQEFGKNGERLSTGRAAELGNPKLDASAFVATANTWLFRRGEQGVEVLFQKRSPYVDRNAGLWDRSAGGHVNFGEKVVDAAVRELSEEIGVSVSDDEMSLVSAQVSNFSNMFVNVFVCDFTGKAEEFRFDDKEVSEVRWVPLAEMDDFIARFAKPPVQEDTESLSLVKKWFRERGNS